MIYKNIAAGIGLAAQHPHKMLKKGAQKMGGTLKIKEEAVELNRRFTDQLEALGFQRVLGTTEYPGGQAGDPQFVQSIRPLITGYNNGRMVACDLWGAPWLVQLKSLSEDARAKLDSLTIGFQSGAWVPHSNGCDDRCTFCHPPNIVHIDRSTPFDLIALLGQGWSIVEQDERSLALTELDLNMVKLMATPLSGEENFRRLKKAKHILLDAKILQTLLENPSQILETWKGKTIHFWGTILHDPNAESHVLYLCWRDDQPHWGCRWLAHNWFNHEFAAVLAAA